MYKIPEEFDADVLVNQTINQVCYTISQIGLYWDEGNIQIMGPFTVFWNNQVFEFQELYPITNDLHVLNVLNKKITRVDISYERDVLMIYFEDHTILTLNSDPCYESFYISVH